MFDKKEIMAKVISQLEANLETLVKVANDARLEATHEEAKAENKYDTRGLEASYLAGAQAKRAVEMRDSIALFKKIEFRNYTDETPVESTALVEVEVNGESSKWFFMLPHHGGIKVEIEGEMISTISPSSPIGKGMFGKSVGGGFEIRQKGEITEYEITQIW